MSGMNHFRTTKNSEKHQLGRNNEAVGTEVLQMGAVECSGEKPQFEKLLKYFSSDEMLRCWWHFLGRLVHSQKNCTVGHL